MEGRESKFSLRGRGTNPFRHYVGICPVELFSIEIKGLYIFEKKAYSFPVTVPVPYFFGHVVKI